jgi:hypothetical protein
MFEFDGGVSLFGVDRIANFGLFETAINQGKKPFPKSAYFAIDP